MGLFKSQPKPVPNAQFMSNLMGSSLCPPRAEAISLFQTNTLVKRLEEPDWHPINSPEAAKITTEWRAWRGTGGEKSGVCVP